MPGVQSDVYGRRMNLSSKQQEAFDRVMAWHRGDSQTFVLGGYAGAGKTTLAKTIAAEFVRPAFCAFTGKAANVLREKGCAEATTIHGAIYSLRDHDRGQLHQLEIEVDEAKAAGDTSRAALARNRLAELRTHMRRPRFGLNEDAEIGKADLVIVDEYSMLNDRLINDLQKVARKILYLGDPFQLPPVEGECRLQPDLFLEEIHRQALDSPIVRYATDVRQGRSLSHGNERGWLYGSKKYIAASRYGEAEQIIVGLNKTRTAFNRRFRQLRGIEPGADGWPLPQAGEKLICLKNNPVLELFNGMIGHATSEASRADDQRYNLDFDDHVGLPVWSGDVAGEGDKYDGYDESMKQLERFDYGYAITCHKAQGSEFKDVLVYNEPVGGNAEMRRRWLYTSLTRARESVVLVDPA